MNMQTTLYKYYGYSYCQGTKDDTTGYILVHTLVNQPENYLENLEEIKVKIIEHLRLKGIYVDTTEDIKEATLNLIL